MQLHISQRTHLKGVLVCVFLMCRDIELVWALNDIKAYFKYNKFRTGDRLLTGCSFYLQVSGTGRRIINVNKQ